VTGLRCLDVGQSTGGFTDCLLQRGAAQVVGVDVGQGQLHPRLRSDPRVVCIEKCNARELTAQRWWSGGEAALRRSTWSSATCRSSRRRWCGRPRAAARPGGHLLMLVKPQFELQPEHIGKGGWCATPRAVRVRAAAHRAGLHDRACGARTISTARSPAVTATANSSCMGLPFHQFRILSAQDARGREKLRAVRQQLYALRPEFCSVTYGAGGSTQDGTLQTVQEILPKACSGAALLVHRRHAREHP
jgi:hypothetical protein